MSRPAALRRLAPGVAAALCAVAITVVFGTGWLQIGSYLVLAVGWSVLVPGCLVGRATLGRARDLPTELFVAFTVGLALQVPVWAACVGLGIAPAWLLTAYPAVVLAVFAGVPALRRHLHLSAYARHTPTQVAWGLAASYAVTVVVLGLTILRRHPLPPGRGLWYPDMYWHLGIAAETTRSVPPKIPQLATEDLKYHWFSHVHMGVGSMVSHVDALVVVGRLWYFPVYGAVVLGTYVLTVHLSRRPWAGLLAVVVLLVPANIGLVRWISPSGVDTFAGLSPSQMYGLPITLLTVWLLSAAISGRLGRAGWCVLALLALVCAGAKSAILPCLLGGVGLTFLAMVAQRRRPEVRRTLACTGILIGALVVATLALAGGRSGSEPGTFTLERASSVWKALEASGETSSLGLGLVLALLTAVVLSQYLWGLPGLALLGREHRGSPAPWLLGGTFLAGLLAMQVIDHVALSQIYFVRGTLPLLAVLMAWGFALLHDRAARLLPRRTVVLAICVGALLGVAALALIRLASAGERPALPQVDDQLVRAVGAAVLVALVAGVLLLAIHKERPAVAFRLLLASGVIGAAIVPAVGSHPFTTPTMYSGPPTFQTSRTAGEVAGTTWLRRHTPPADLVATNVHCAGRTAPGCDARTFWVSGLGERAMYLEGWGYLDQTQARDGIGGKRYLQQPFYDPQRLADNDQAFTAPTRDRLDVLYAKGVRWLFADTIAGPVSPQLRRHSQQVFGQGEVSIYRLYPPSQS